MDALSSHLASTAYNESKVKQAEAIANNTTNEKTKFDVGLSSKMSSAQKAEEALKDFQSLMVNIMLSSMRSTVQKSEIMNGGQSEEIFEGMLDQEYSKKMASNDMLGMDQSLRKAFHLPLNETFNWKQIEKLPDSSLENIDHQLSSVKVPYESNNVVKEPLAAKVSKKLDAVVKSPKLFENLPPEEVAKLDPEFLRIWKDKREKYLNSKSYDGTLGIGLKEMNKELLQKIFGELNFTEPAPQAGEKRKAATAYSKVSQVLK